MTFTSFQEADDVFCNTEVTAGGGGGVYQGELTGDTHTFD